ncbi:MAG: hypothetical protein LBD23_14295 [Oscillospiraceae bacterium]|nr:hypothetical protein [Oscillospiraceae bacterium]
MKRYIEPDETKHEIKIGSYVADIVNDNGITEIQTRSFNKLRNKLSEYVETSPVTIVYPLPKTKWLMWIDKETGEISKKRKSPKQGSIYDSIYELYKIKPQLAHHNLRLRLVFVDVEEYRYLDGWSRNRKKGSTRYDRIPVEIVDDIYFESIADYAQFIPNNLQSNFTTMDLKKAADINMRTSQTVLNILHYLGTVKRIGKQGNLHVYKRM